jgi:hypothetical protein
VLTLILGCADIDKFINVSTIQHIFQLFHFLCFFKIWANESIELKFVGFSSLWTYSIFSSSNWANESFAYCADAKSGQYDFFLFVVFLKKLMQYW